MRAELKRRWKAQHGEENSGGGEAAGAGMAYPAWVRRERARLLASDSLAGLDRVERAARARKQLKALWIEEKAKEKERLRAAQDMI